MSKRTKIVATVGPSTSSEEVLKAMIEEGVNVFRVNFSHGVHQDHIEVIKKVRTVDEQLGTHSAILADLQGPKLRIGTFVQDKIELKKGQSFILDLDSSPGNKDRVNFPHEEIENIKLKETIRNQIKLITQQGNDITLKNSLIATLTQDIQNLKQPNVDLLDINFN